MQAAQSVKPRIKLQKHKSDVNNVESLVRVMLKKHRTPFMIIRRCVLEKQYRRFRKCLPDVTPYYAIKANLYLLIESVVHAHIYVYLLCKEQEPPRGAPLA